MTDKPRLYLLTPPKIPHLADFVAQLRDAFSGGDVGCLQLRLKDASDEEITGVARVLMPMAHSHACAFIMNDRPDLAAACGADGVHLGQDDLSEWPVAKARSLMGEGKVIGVSAHASRDMAMQAGDKGADYVAFGAFYPTKTKSPEKIAQYGIPTPEIVEWWSTYTVLPCVAIGGMMPANCAPLVKAGADFIAAITAVWEHPEGPGKAVQEFNQNFKNAA